LLYGADANALRYIIRLLPFKCSTERLSTELIAPRRQERKERHLPISPNLAYFASLRESWSFRLCNPNSTENQIFDYAYVVQTLAAGWLRRARHAEVAGRRWHRPTVGRQKVHDSKLDRARFLLS